MIEKRKNIVRGLMVIGIASWFAGQPLLLETSAQRRTTSTTRSTTTGTRYGGSATRTTTTRTTTTSAQHHGTVVHGEEGYAAVGRRGAVAANEEGVAAVGRYGNAVVANEEGVAARGRYGNVVVAETYETHDAWRTAAAVTTGIAIGTMLAHPPTGATTVVVTGTTYWVHANTYYRRVYVGGAVHYQVVARPL